MKTFLIGPVRGYPLTELEEDVSRLEGQGYEVHWPARDTDQDCNTGIHICEQNRKAIYEADAVHVIWDGKSQGVLFDLGMAFALNKRAIVISLPPMTEGKSFQNMVRMWAE